MNLKEADTPKKINQFIKERKKERKYVKGDKNKFDRTLNSMMNLPEKSKSTRGTSARGSS